MTARSKQAARAETEPKVSGSGPERGQAGQTGHPYRAVLRGWAFRPQLQAVHVVSKKDFPLEWGIIQHNLGTSYVSLARVSADRSRRLAALNSSIKHLRSSFEVREPEQALQYWIASSRSLAEALIDKGVVEMGDNSRRSMSCARAILERALARVNGGEHPHQWAELRAQLARFDPE